MHFNMLKSIIVDKKGYTYYIKMRNTKMYLFSMTVFAMKERPVPFFLGAL
jgi:hypothetical protein